jgi:hypothetical protein
VPEKVFAFRVTRPETHGNSWCVYGDWDSVHDAELDDATPGDKITVELIEMTKEELDELEPFEGW